MGSEVSKAKDKGTYAESLVVKHLKNNGWADAHRSALAGVNDIGDIVTPGITWQVKNQNTLHIPQWLRETRTQRDVAGNAWGVLVAKPAGVGAAAVGRWLAVMLRSEWAMLAECCTRLPTLTRSYSLLPSLYLNTLSDRGGVVTVPFRKNVEVHGEDKFAIMHLDTAMGMLLQWARMSDWTMR